MFKSTSPPLSWQDLSWQDAEKSLLGAEVCLISSTLFRGPSHTLPLCMHAMSTH